MYHLAGEKYVPSKKLNFTYWSISLLVGFFAAVGIGVLYALVSMINPFIYLNFVVLACAVVLLAGIVIIIKSIGKSRNPLADMVACIIICLAAWLAQWAYIATDVTRAGFWTAFFSIPDLLDFVLYFASHRNMSIGRFGSSGMSLDPAILSIGYLIELGAIMFPVYILRKQSSYYCEECDTPYSSVTTYLKEDEIIYNNQHEIEKGNLTFLQEYPFYQNLDALPLDPKLKPPISTVEYHYCKKCNNNSIVNINAGVLKQNDKKRREMGKSTAILKDTYINPESNRLLLTRLNLFSASLGLSI